MFISTPSSLKVRYNPTLGRILLTHSIADAILTSLHFDGVERYLERPLNPHPGTFEWLYDPDLCKHKCETCAPQGSGYPWISDRYSACRCRQIERGMREHGEKLQAWLQSSNDIFWIYGKAGSGKSTFMKFLFEHKQTRVHLDNWAHGNVTIAASFFWSAGSELEKSNAGLLRALLYQVLDQHPELIQVVFPERWKAVLRSSTQQKPWTEKELSIALKLLSQAPISNLRLFFLIDGLDEFSGDHQDLIESLQELNKSPAIKICVSSRPWIVFESTYASNVHCSMELHKLTVRDIDIYIAAKLESMRHQGVLTGDELETLGNDVRVRAEGVFLWVTLAIRDLRRGIGKRDSMPVLQKRLADYPSELRDFYQHILDNIDPVYRSFTGRLLLTMVSSRHKPDLICLHLWEKYSCDTDNVNDTQWSPKSGPESHQLLEQGESYAKNWAGDLIDPVPTRLSCDSPDSCDFTIAMFIGGPSPSFSHQTVYQFIQQKADDGTLAEMAGPGFDPLLAYQYLLLGLSRYCTDLEDFTEIIGLALSLRLDLDRLQDTNPSFVEPIIQIALAFDQIGQQITRPRHQTHWTIDLLRKKQPRLPFDCQHSTLMSLLLNLDARSDFLVGKLLELQSHSITDGQRRFLLESAFIPDLYIEDFDGEGEPHLPQEIVMELIKTSADVNEPIRRVKCSLEYSTWQIFLLWLHDEMAWEFTLYGSINVTEIFHAFLSSGADPCASVSNKDLKRPDYEGGCTLVGNAALVSATELLEDVKEHFGKYADAEATIAEIDCAQKLLAETTQGSSRH
jgi:hypothetical protein